MITSKLTCWCIVFCTGRYMLLTLVIFCASFLCLRTSGSKLCTQHSTSCSNLYLWYFHLIFCAVSASLHIFILWQCMHPTFSSWCAAFAFSLFAASVKHLDLAWNFFSWHHLVCDAFIQHIQRSAVPERGRRRTSRAYGYEELIRGQCFAAVSRRHGQYVLHHACSSICALVLIFLCVMCLCKCRN